MLSHIPLIFLVFDFIANRIYYPISLMVMYSIYAYSIAVIFIAVREDVEMLIKLPELKYFDEVKNANLAWSLPIQISIALYAA